nr:PREDICTED: protein FAM90A1 [Rhinolophus sinicus]
MRAVSKTSGLDSSTGPLAYVSATASNQGPGRWVKCKDCGAFGHRVSSFRCPMKCWQGALVPQPLGPSKMKENLKPCTPRDLRNPGSFTRAERQNEPNPRREQQQGQAGLQRFPTSRQGRPQHNRKESTEYCDYVRHPTRPMPVHTTKRKGVLDADLTSSSPPTRKPDMTSMASPTKKPERSILQCPGLYTGQGVPLSGMPHPADKHFLQDPHHIVQQRDNRPHLVPLGDPQAASKTHGLGHALISQAQPKFPEVKSHTIGYGEAQSWGHDSKRCVKAPGKRAAQIPIEMCHSPQKIPRIGPLDTPQKSTERSDLRAFQTLHPPARPRPAVAPQVTMMTPAQEHSIDFQPPRNGSLLKTVQACVMPQPPPTDQVPGQSLRMVFRRLGRGQWSCRFMTAPSFSPAQKSSSPGQSPPISEKSEGHWTRVPWSVLYDDLQVSSSSEESDGQ